MKSRRKIYWGLGITVIIISVIAVLTFTKAVEVETVKAESGVIQRTVVENGTVYAKSGQDLYTAAGGTVISLPVEVGQPVKTGDVIAVLDNPEIALQLSNAKTQLAQVESAVTSYQGSLDGIRLELSAAQINLERIEKLYNSGAASRADYDNALLAVEKLKNSIQELTKNIAAARQQETSLANALNIAELSNEKLIIKSPADGKLMYLNCDEGQVIMPGAALAGIAASEELEVRVDVLSDDIAEVAEGQSASITSTALEDKVLTGQVTKVYPQAEEKTSALGVIQRRVPVIIRLEDVQNLKPGYEVRVAINTVKKENVVILPRDAIRTNTDNQQEVMAVENNKIIIRTVETGIYDSDNIEIIKGLDKGVIVVKDADTQLAEGTKVKIRA